MTFQTYSRLSRMGAAMGDIRNGSKLAGLPAGHGFESDSGFRDAFRKTFGRTPGESRSQGCVVTHTLESPVGPLLVGATTDAVCLLEFTDRRALERQMETVRRRFSAAVVPGKNQWIEQLSRELSQYFAGSLKRFSVPLATPGTEFQRAVWSSLQKIPYGQTISYEQLAINVDKPGAQRAVGRANGDNRIAIVIPCHRVVNKSGQLGGYGGGLWRKQFLLNHERKVLQSE